MGFNVLIPARYHSSRLPGKPLCELAGRPLIQYVFNCALKSGAGRVMVATDDDRIRLVAERFGAEVCMTSKHHASGTDRLAEAAQILNFSDDEIVVNLQGDEPFIPPALIRQVAENLQSHPEASVATLCEPIRHNAHLFDPNICKVVMDHQGYALYFSRAPIPWDRDAFSLAPPGLAGRQEYYRHIGLYSYRVGFLKEYTHWPVCTLEQAERLEQLRVIYHGRKVHVAEAVEAPGQGVDTEEDLLRAQSLLSNIE